VVAVSPNPYLFVVGCPRSGTTLLQRMLDARVLPEDWRDGIDLKNATDIQAQPPTLPYHVT